MQCRLKTSAKPMSEGTGVAVRAAVTTTDDWVPGFVGPIDATVVLIIHGVLLLDGLPGSPGRRLSISSGVNSH